MTELVSPHPFHLQVIAARERITDLVSTTPFDGSDMLSGEAGPNAQVLYKREDLLGPVYTFKLRGAANAIMSLGLEQRQRGVIAASAGNHAQGVAYTAQQLEVPTVIVMPETTPDQKISAVERFGAKIVLDGSSYSDAYARSLEIQAEQGMSYIHPFDDPNVIAGQATVAAEMLAARKDLSHIFVPVGGGGLLAGVLQLVKEVRPSLQVVGVQAADSDAMARSLETGQIVNLHQVGTFSDGTAVKRVGERTFEIAKQMGVSMVRVTEQQLVEAMADFVTETRSVLEPAGALAIAGLREYCGVNGQLPEGSVAGLICSGGNVDNTRLAHALTQAERASDRNALFRIALDEHPGALLQLCEEVVNGHNITQFSYRRDSTASEAQITVGLRVKDQRDRADIAEKLVKTDHVYTDLTDNLLIREHGIMSRGAAPDCGNESFYAIEFADRPGALLDLLRNIGCKWNISLFHYGGSEGDVGRVVIGFESTDKRALEKVLSEHTRDFQNADEDVVLMYA
jgi:threonine dehydratase